MKTGMLSKGLSGMKLEIVVLTGREKIVELIKFLCSVCTGCWLVQTCQTFIGVGTFWAYYRTFKKSHQQEAKQLSKQ